MDVPTATTRKPYLVIRPPKGWAALDLGELWHFRDLLFTLAMRDIKLRYRQTALGIAWVIFQPLVGAGAFTLVFGLLAKLPTNGIPTFVISYAGLLGWNVFSSTISKGGISLIGNANLVSKVYFPRLALPFSTVLSTLLDFAVALVVLAIMMAWFHIMPGPRTLLMPVLLLLLLAFSCGATLLTAALTVSYRDVQYVVPVLVNLLQYVSPVGYLVATNVPEKYLKYYMLNPLAPLIEAFRWSLLGHEVIHWGYLGYSAAVSVVILFVGTWAFKVMERKFADVI